MHHDFCLDTPTPTSWLLFVPTRAPEGGFHARVRLCHDTEEVFALCADADGTWLKHFFDIESYIDWLDGIAAGPVRSLRREQPLPRQDGVA
jgi:hypothetical protein